MSSLTCKEGLRRENVRQDGQHYGLDYLEVERIKKSESSLETQCILTVYFLGKAPPNKYKLDEKNISTIGKLGTPAIAPGTADKKLCSRCRAEARELDEHDEELL